MIVSCEQCAKKYKIDETKLKEEKTLFKCEGCGSIMEAIKPQSQTEVPRLDSQQDTISPSMDAGGSSSGAETHEDLFASSAPDAKTAPKKAKPKKKKAPKGPGMSIRLKLLIGFLFFITILCGVITFL